MCSFATHVEYLTNNKLYNENGKFVIGKIVERAWLVCYLMEIKKSQSDKEHYKSFIFIRSVIGWNMSNVVAMFADNGNANRAMSRGIGPTFVRSHSQ